MDCQRVNLAKLQICAWQSTDKTEANAFATGGDALRKIGKHVAGDFKPPKETGPITVDLDPSNATLAQMLERKMFGLKGFRTPK